MDFGPFTIVDIKDSGRALSKWQRKRRMNATWQRSFAFALFEDETPVASVKCELEGENVVVQKGDWDDDDDWWLWELFENRSILVQQNFRAKCDIYESGRPTSYLKFEQEWERLKGQVFDGSVGAEMSGLLESEPDKSPHPDWSINRRSGEAMGHVTATPPAGVWLSPELSRSERTKTAAEYRGLPR